MTNDEINIAIAESVGWHPHPDNDKREQKCWTYGGTGYGLPNGKPKRSAAMPPIEEGIWPGSGPLPNYCKDLNAMREAELTLWRDPCDVETYEENLLKEVLNAVGYQGADTWFMASAGIRAIAFLKTIGKWKE
jgi:hypothetical protein